MLKRKITEYLYNWKQTKKDECLFVKGVRQVGKTFAIRYFGKNNYKSFIEINFIEHPEYQDIFSGELSAKEIKKQISLTLLEALFIPGDTLLFLDEIQECPNARTALKFLAQDNEMDVVVSGSLLGISYKDNDLISVPVGYEKQIEMHPLDLEEFLWALGYDENKIIALKTYFDELKTVPQTIHESMLKNLREYMVVGGMPAVVQEYVNTYNFAEVYRKQTSLLDSYLDDIAKFAPVNTRIKARECFESVPKQLAKENSKFQYSVVEKGGTARKFGTTVDWLEEAELVNRCVCVNSPQFPLSSYEQNNRFRFYLADMGLLTAMYGYEMMSAVVNDTLKGPTKGGYYENLVACMLVSSKKSLHYWVNKNATEEIEFLIDSNASVVPIEVKAKKGATATLNKMLEKENIEFGYKLGSINVGKVGKKITLPLYMGMFLFPSCY